MSSNENYVFLVINTVNIHPTFGGGGGGWFVENDTLGKSALEKLNTVKPG
jgi:hypothetical protein